MRFGDHRDKRYNIMADQGPNTSSTTVMRDYRKGNWTVSETMILIEAKKMDDERRMKRITGPENDQGRSTTTTTTTTSKPAELRWKWVEDYCWRKGCMRSQNQCNDKWDNLMRDYKKVRDYDRKLAEKSGGVSENQSYWKIEKNERKEKNLPTNMLPQIYEALVDVVERKSQRVSGVSSIPSSSPSIGYQMVERTMSGGGGVHHPHHHLQQPPLMASQALLQPVHHISATPVAALPLPPAPVTVAAAKVAAATPYVQGQPPPPALPYPQPILSTVGIFTLWSIYIVASSNNKKTVFIMRIKNTIFLLSNLSSFSFDLCDFFSLYEAN